MNSNSNKKLPKKLLIQAIISIFLFSILYLCELNPSAISEKVNNFREYALIHNTDFKYILNNTTSTVSTMTDILIDPEASAVFSPGVPAETIPPSPAPSPNAVSEE